MNLPEEPLHLSAALARHVAGQLCRRGSASGESCAWYHGLWQDLRVIGLAASPERQAQFFLDAFHEFAKQSGRSRVLISGAADYSILAYVLWACVENAIEVHVTVVDRCATPLLLNTWYAERAGQSVATVCADILEYRADVPFDVICSHSFLGQFAPDCRPNLVGQWARLLRPGGMVLAVNRLRPADGPSELRFSPAEAREFCAQVAQRIGRIPALSPHDRQQIVRRTRIYVERSQTYSLAPEELAALFVQNGFQIDRLSSIISSDPQNRDMGGKAIPKDARHACLLARKLESAAPAVTCTSLSP